MTKRLSTLAGVSAAIAAVATASAAPRSDRRLPPGAQWGRCLLVVHAQVRISGPCVYSLSPDGGFHIDGPRQVFDGIDYPKAEIMAQMRSTDFWADVFRNDDGTWTGYGNGDIRSVHGDHPTFGLLVREGPCFIGDGVRICLWPD